MQHISIAIDGPAGAGKSTVAKEVARRIGILYVDTGAMYRTIAWLALENGVSPNDVDGLERLIAEHEIRMAKSDAGTLQIRVDDVAVSDVLRTQAVSNAVSLVSVHPQVRQVLTGWQRTLSQQTSVVMDGRDIGTVVLPHANVKIFLTASLEERAMRRAKEFAERGISIAVGQLANDLEVRDERDSTREVAPLKPAEEAHLIDSTGKSIDQVVDEILTYVG